MVLHQNLAFLIPLVMILGLAINVSFTLFQMNWCNSPAQRCVAILLPLVVLIITKVIASNLALALGMVGALSIVRFRSPVKNPFELVTFFSFIAIGVGGSVHYFYALIIAGATIVTPMMNSVLQHYLASRLSNQDQHFSERTLATFKMPRVTNIDSVLNLLQLHEADLHSVYRTTNPSGTGENIEVTFFISGVSKFNAMSDEFLKCTDEVNSALHQY